MTPAYHQAAPMIRLLALFGLTGLSAAASCILAAPPLRLGRNLVLVNNTAGSSVRQRQFWLVTPALASNLTTIVALHGTGFSAAEFLSQSSLDVLGTAAGYVVVAPDGLPERIPFTSIIRGGSWQLGNRRGDGRSDLYPVDDKTFVKEVLDCSAALLPPGSLNRRVMLAGWSNGGKLAARLGCEGIPDWDGQAVAAASGIQLDEGQRCANGPPPLVLFQGSSDIVVPFCRKAPYGPLAFEPTRPEFARWSGGNASLVATLCAGNNVTQYAYASTSGSAKFSSLFWTAGGIHEWPASLDGCSGGATRVALELFAAVEAGRMPTLCTEMRACQAREPC